MPDLKRALFDRCLQQVNDRITWLNQELEALKRSAESDTKSSMGDKYETGREMINLEKGKIAEQLADSLKMKQVLDGLDLNRRFNKCELGSLIRTKTTSYFLAISIGKVSVGKEDFFVISPISPIGQELLGKQVGESITFAGKSIEIMSID